MIKPTITKLKSIYNTILKYSHYAFEETGKNKITQFFEILRFRMQGFHESEYYILSLYKKNKNFVSLKMHLENIRTLNPPVRGMIEFNKYIFSQYMLAHGFSTPKCYGILHETFGFTKDQNKLKDIKDLRNFLKSIVNPLVFKPVGDTAQGVGVFIIEKYNIINDTVVVNGNDCLHLTNFYKKLDAVNKSGVLIQDKIVQHSILSKIHPNSVNCVRIYSFINEMNDVEILGAIVKFGSNGSVVDNTKLSDGLFTKVDIETGILGKSYNFYDPKPLENHPFTNEIIQGLNLPFWHEVKQLTKQAHFILPFAGTFGWDIAIEQEGPTIIEVNGGWYHNHFQKAMQMSLKDTHLEEIVRSKKATN